MFTHFTRQRLRQVGLHEDHGGKLIAGIELEVLLVFARVAVLARVGAAAVRIEGPLEWHALRPIERGLHVHFLIRGLIRPPLGLGQLTGE